MIRRVKVKDPSTILLTFRVTPEEGDRIRGLAWYLGCSYAELFREYETSLRKALYMAGMRPPLQAPEDALRSTRSTQTTRRQVLIDVRVRNIDQEPESRGPKTPRGKP